MFRHNAVSFMQTRQLLEFVGLGASNQDSLVERILGLESTGLEFYPCFVI